MTDSDTPVFMQEVDNIHVSAAGHLFALVGFKTSETLEDFWLGLLVRADCHDENGEFIAPSLREQL